MSRLLSLIFCILAMAAAVYYFLTHRPDGAGGLSPEGPKQQLDRVRQQTKQIEREAQKRADDAVKKSSE
jgi:hypothetical protein